MLYYLVGIGAYWGYKKVTATFKDNSTLNEKFSVNSASLIKDFSDDEKSANKKYNDQLIKVAGMVKEIDQDEKGNYVFIIGDTASSSSVKCSMDSVHNVELVNIKKYSQITVKGVCTGFNADELLGSDVILIRSVIDKNKK